MFYLSIYTMKFKPGFEFIFSKYYLHLCNKKFNNLSCSSVVTYLQYMLHICSHHLYGNPSLFAPNFNLSCISNFSLWKNVTATTLWRKDLVQLVVSGAFSPSWQKGMTGRLCPWQPKLIGAAVAAAGVADRAGNNENSMAGPGYIPHWWS